MPASNLMLPKTDQLVEAGLKALDRGDVATARRSFEAACLAEEAEGKDPEKNAGILLLMTNILAVTALATAKEKDPEGFKKLQQALQEAKTEINL